MLPFTDRSEAGRLLGAELLRLSLDKPRIVVALSRGGVPVGFEVSEALHAPLEILIVRKIGVPWQPELAMGSIADGAPPYLDQTLIDELGVSRDALDAIIQKERAEIARREHLYRQGRPPMSLAGLNVVIVDDGLATGSTMESAIRYVRLHKALSVIAAAPIGTRQACRWLRQEAGNCVCLAMPEPFSSVGEWYRDFAQVSDDEVVRLLHAKHGSTRPEGLF